MENPIRDDSYESAKKEAREVYDKIDRVWCPALNDHVVFNSDGFRHLIWKGKKRRPNDQQISRFSLLIHASEIVGNPSLKTTLRKRKVPSRAKWQKIKVPIKSDASFWAFRQKIEEKQIRVIVRQVGNGQKYFFSIFKENDNKQKTAQR